MSVPDHHTSAQRHQVTPADLARPANETPGNEGPSVISVIAGHDIPVRPVAAEEWQATQIGVVVYQGATSGQLPATQLLPRDQLRRQAVITAIGGTIYIAPTIDQATPTQGFPIGAGSTYTHNAMGPVYAVAAAAGSSAAVAFERDER